MERLEKCNHKLDKVRHCTATALHAGKTVSCASLPEIKQPCAKNTSAIAYLTGAPEFLST